MIWYSPILPLLIGTLFLAGAALIARPRLALPGLLLILPALALMTPLGANLLVLAVENRIKAAEKAPVCQQIQLAVLLSGGLNRPAETNSDFAALTTESLNRSFAWRDIASNEASTELQWVIAGGGPFRISEAEVMAAFLHQLDGDQPPLQLETASATTRESAQALRAQLPESTHRIALASSALHLPRATLAFEQAGFEVCPVVLNRHYMAVTGWSSLLPQSSSLAKSEAALHEIIGEFFYRIKQPGTHNGVSQS